MQHHRPANLVERRRFLWQAAAGLALAGQFRIGAEEEAAMAKKGFRAVARDLLSDWGGGLRGQQIEAPADPARHGAFRCPACAGRLHGRCADSFLPFLYLAEKTGDEAWLKAALAVHGWMRNVESGDGSWTNETDPKSWKGITVFTAIALGEALERHGQLLDEPFRAAMRARLKRAGDFIRANFKPEYSNINYTAAGAHGLSLLGRLLDEADFRRRGRELARETLRFFTPRDRFLFGEGKPQDRVSPGGCRPVDLGYNVEESLPSLVHYALAEGDQEVLEVVLSSWKTHLEFMLPDGGWDNSWGTRMFKWTWWGSRTSDGCQEALTRLAEREPVFGVAAWRNLLLLRQCTKAGLLHGGPHLAGRGVPPCVHHTFCHAKTLAGALHFLGEQGDPVTAGQLPRERATGVREYPEVGVRLVAAGPWRATVSGNDWIYKPGVSHACGGSLGALWHGKLGILAAASMPCYLMAEEHNMQPLPDGEEFPLTPRIEMREGDGWFTNLHDTAAVIGHRAEADMIEVTVDTRLVNEEGKAPAGGPMRFRLVYQISPGAVRVSAKPVDATDVPWSLVFPLVSPSGEAVRRISARCIEVVKPGGTALMESNVPMERAATKHERVFHVVPGLEALPWVLHAREVGEVWCELRPAAG